MCALGQCFSFSGIFAGSQPLVSPTGLIPPSVSQMASVRTAFQQPEITELMGGFFGRHLHPSIVALPELHPRKATQNGTSPISIANTSLNSGFVHCHIEFPGLYNIAKAK